MVHEQVLKLCIEQDVPIDALTQPIALVANRGGGKTFGGMKIFELAYDLDVQCGALDPIGKWWGLRLGKDGKSAGLKNVYIFGGKHADFPLQADKGAFTAKLVVEKRIHFILDVSLMRKGERRRFMAAFLEELYLLKKQQDNPTPMVLFLEEAHFVAPQKPQIDEAQMLGAIQDIVTEGRNAGIGVVLMDQRPARVNKDVLALVEVLVVLRIIHNIDRAAVTDWIVQKTDDKKVKLSEELPFLKNGAGYLYAPVYGLFGKIQILPKRTYDSTASVKIGQRRADIGQLTPVDAEAVKSAMAEVLQEAEANDPKALKRRVLELERQLQARPPAVSSVAATKTPKPAKVEVPVFRETDVSRLEKVVQDALAGAERLVSRIREPIEVMNRQLNTARLSVTQAKTLFEKDWSSKADVLSDQHRRALTAPAARPVAPRRVEQVLDGEDVTEPQQRILDTLASFEALGITSPRRENVAVMSNQSSISSGFQNNLGHLRTVGLISYPKNGEVALTPEGRSRSTGFEIRSVAQIHAAWERKLPKPQWAILSALIDLFPGDVDRPTLAETARQSVDSSGFQNNLGTMRSLGIIDYPSSGRVVATELLFPNALARSA